MYLLKYMTWWKAGYKAHKNIQEAAVLQVGKKMYEIQYWVWEWLYMLPGSVP